MAAVLFGMGNTIVDLLEHTICRRPTAGCEPPRKIQGSPSRALSIYSVLIMSSQCAPCGDLSCGRRHLTHDRPALGG